MFVLLFALFLIESTSLALPNDVRLCKFDDNECILDTANYILQKHYNGIKSHLDAVDPLRIDAMNVEQVGGPVSILAKLRNVDILGFSKAKIYKLEGFENNLIDLRMRISTAALIGLYDIKGKILILPVNGVGKIKLTFKNFDVKLTLPFAKEARDGKTFIKIDQPNLSFDITGGDVHLSHLGVIGNGFLNSNFNTIISSIKSAISKPLAEELSQKINLFFQTRSVEQLFVA